MDGLRPSAESAETRLKIWTTQEIQESTNLVGVTMTMPEGHVILDCGAVLDCIGEVAAARTSSGHHRAWRNTSPCSCGQNSTCQIWR